MRDPLAAAVAHLLAKVAEDSFVTQAELSRRTGIGQPLISRTFGGLRTISFDEADALCAALGVDLLAVIDEARRSLH